MAVKIIPQDFYVYTHHKATTGEIFYVGKGHGRRAWEKADRNPFWKRIVSKHGVVVKVAQDGLQEWAAFELECDLIALHGRRNLGDGSLVNLTDGGDGASGTVVGDETRAKLSATNTMVGKNPELRALRKDLSFAMWREEKHRIDVVNAMRVAHTRQDEKDRKRKATIACHKDPAYRANYLAKRGNKPIVCVTTGQIFETSYCAQKWLVGTGKTSATSGKVRECCKGKYKTAYGYTWAYA